MIKKIKISNFRCFDDFEVNDFSPVTIIGGANNSGKSTLLESILINSVGGNLGVFWALVNIRNAYTASPMLPHQLWGPLFGNDKNIEIIAEWNEGTNSKLNISKIQDFGIQNQPNEVLSSINLNFESSNYTINGKCFIQNDMMQSNRIVFKPDIGEDINPEVFNGMFDKIMLYKGVPYDAGLAERISKMMLDAEKRDVLMQVLQEFDKKIVDVRVVLDNRTPSTYVVLEKGRPLSINYMGDGINKALLIVSNILSLKNGVLLIDEIENGFYYELYKPILKIFCEVALKNGCQIIMTTHNITIIETILEIMEEIGRIDDLCYNRIDISAKTNERNAKKISGQALKSAFEANMEIR